jgi:hypothetical protein
VGDELFSRCRFRPHYQGTDGSVELVCSAAGISGSLQERLVYTIAENPYPHWPLLPVLGHSHVVYKGAGVLRHGDSFWPVPAAFYCTAVWCQGDEPGHCLNGCDI